MTTSELINARNEIARLALNGDNRYWHEAIGESDGDVNLMETEIDLPLVHRSLNTNDAAVYSDGNRHVLICYAHGPCAIELLGGAA